MPQQHLTSPHKVSKGISLGRVFCNDAAEYVDFVTHQASVGFGQSVPLVDSDGVTGQHNALVGLHSTTFHISRKGQG